MIARSRRALSGTLHEYRVAAAAFSGNARAYLLLATLQNVAMGILVTVFALYMKAWGMSEAVVGDAEGMLALASAVLALLAAPLISVFGYRRLLIAAGCAYALSKLGQALWPVTAAVLVFGLVAGIGDGVMRAAASAFLSEHSEEQERTHLFAVDLMVRLGAAFVGSVLGGVMVALLGTWMPEADALRWAVVASAAIFASAVLPALVIREDLHPARHALAAYRTTVAAFSSWGHLFRLAVPQFVISVGAGLVMPFLSLFLRHQLGASVGEIGVVQGVSQVAMCVAVVAAPWLGRRFGLIKGTVLTEVLSLPLLALLPSVGFLPAAAVVIWLRSALMNMSWPLLNQYSMEDVPSAEKPLVAAGLAFGWSAGWLAGAVIGGRLMALSYTTPYYVTVAMYGAGALLTWVLLGRRDVRGALPDES